MRRSIASSRSGSISGYTLQRPRRFIKVLFGVDHHLFRSREWVRKPWTLSLGNTEVTTRKASEAPTPPPAGRPAPSSLTAINDPACVTDHEHKLPRTTSPQGSIQHAMTLQELEHIQGTFSTPSARRRPAGPLTNTHGGAVGVKGNNLRFHLYPKKPRRHSNHERQAGDAGAYAATIGLESKLPGASRAQQTRWAHIKIFLPRFAVHMERVLGCFYSFGRAARELAQDAAAESATPPSAETRRKEFQSRDHIVSLRPFLQLGSRESRRLRRPNLSSAAGSGG